ncbi:hypothetical protein GOP47_0021985 [Adiantum capillus-veneris]|uniref:Uncharacterized protein n=1 Tax=Adiantum capillus-veneris TaxID=13818 RepID=A0A9D4U9F3_ADICA|nr:hypothetical protein GOP47_0021985 [Adiantum capillus-veneris]
MPFSSDADDRPPRRNARSFDLDDSATKAAAWVWHLHESKPGVTTEGRFVTAAQGWRRSSGSSDRKISRFRQEAAGTSTGTKEGCGAMKSETPMWDCGSNLYDTFELVAFGNRLDRSLMEVVPLSTHPLPPPGHLQPHVEHHMPSPLRERGGVLRTLSLPKSSQARRQASKKKHGNSAVANDGNRVSLSKSRELSFSVFQEGQGSRRWPSVEKVMKAFKKVVVLHKQVSLNVGCKQSIKIVEPGQRPLEPSRGEYRDKNEVLGEGSKDRKLSSINNVNDDDKSSSLQNWMKGRRKSTDEELLFSRISEGTISSHQSKERSVVKPQISSRNYHKHLHHHHHHHHHHHMHHTMGSESARLSPETLSKICTENGW